MYDKGSRERPKNYISTGEKERKRFISTGQKIHVYFLCSTEKKLTCGLKSGSDVT